MGIFSVFSDANNSVKLQEHASKINSSTSEIFKILQRCGDSKPYGDARIQIMGYIQRIEDNLIAMNNILKNSNSARLFQTMVSCVDGHKTAVPGYVVAMNQMVREMRHDLL